MAQAGYSTGQPPDVSRHGEGRCRHINNLAGNATDPTSKIPCNLGLTLYVGDGKTVPAAANDGIAVKNDLVLAIKRVNVADCALAVDAALPAGFVTVPNGTALKFHVKKTPFQQPLPGVDNSVVNVTSSVGKTVRVRQKVGRVFKIVTRGLFESIGCKAGAHKVNVAFTPAGGGAALNASKTAPCSEVARDA